MSHVERPATSHDKTYAGVRRASKRGQSVHGSNDNSTTCARRPTNSPRRSCSTTASTRLGTSAGQGEFETKICLAEMALRDARLDELDVEGLLAFVQHLLSNTARLWLAANPEQKQRL